MQSDAVITALAALAQSNRLSIFRALVVAGRRGKTPTDLAEELGMAPATLSFHLKELTRAGLLHKHQQGRFIHYQANFSTMDQLIGYLTENCCQGEACDIDAVRCETDQTGETR